MKENSMKEISKFKKMVVESFGIAAESGAVMAIDILVNAILGTFANGIVAAKFSYQLKRLEDNFKIAIPEMIRRLDKIEGVLTEEKQNVIESEVLPAYWDCVQQEPEEEKKDDIQVIKDYHGDGTIINPLDNPTDTKSDKKDDDGIDEPTK